MKNIYIQISLKHSQHKKRSVYFYYLNVDKKLRRVKTGNTWNPSNTNCYQPNHATPIVKNNYLCNMISVSVILDKL